MLTTTPFRHAALDHRPVVRHLRPSVRNRILLRFQTRGKLTWRSPRRPVLNPFTQAIAHPVRVNQIPRQIPPQPTYLRPWVRDSLAAWTPLLTPVRQATTILAGILPFGTPILHSITLPN